MSKDIFPQGRTIEENLDILVEEIKLAVQWDRPSILLVIYKSKFGQVKIQNALEARLKALGQSCVRFEASREQPNILPLLLNVPNKERSVFFISNIERGGPEAYRALNLYREVFIENRIRVVFWLSASEAAHLPHRAPDFWAFRHKTVEFSRRQAPRKIQLPAGLLLWLLDDQKALTSNLNEQIVSREKMLVSMPASAESTSTRVGLLSVLGYLHWAAGDSSKAIQVLDEGLRISKGRDLISTESTLLNGKGNLFYDAGNYPESIETYQKALEKNPQNFDVLMNLSIAYCAIGQKDKAISLAKRAANANPRNARLWHSLGYLYDSMGRSEEALACFSEAAALAPHVAEYHESLAIYFAEADDREKAVREISLAREASMKNDPSFPIIEEVVTGSSDKALILLNQTLQKQQISRLELIRNPVLNKLFDIPQRGNT